MAVDWAVEPVVVDWAMAEPATRAAAKIEVANMFAREVERDDGIESS